MVDAQEAVLAVDDHADRVETDRLGPGPRAAALVQPSVRKASQPLALSDAQPRKRLVLRAEASPAATRAPGLDLCEDEHVPIACDQVDLAVAGAHVALHQHEPESPEMRDREILPDGSEHAARVLSCRDSEMGSIYDGHASIIGV